MLEIRLLGPVEAVVFASPVRLTPTQQTIVALLALRWPEAVAADALADVIWGEAPPPAAAASLQAQISRLRASLGPGAIEGHNGSYRLAPHQTDADEVVRLIERGLTAPDIADIAARFRGRPLGDLGDVDAFRGWRARLEGVRDRFDAAAVEAEVAAGLTEDAIARLSVMVERDPLREAWWRRMAEVLAGAGRRPEAIRVLTRCREALTEVGLEPSPELAAFEDLLLSPSAGFGLDRGLPLLVGRDSELASLAEMTATERIVSIVGPGGVGKTTLARAVAATGGLRWCDLSSVDDGQAAVTAMARAVGAPLIVPFVPTLEAFLQVRPTGLVLDNCEHVAETVAPLVDRLIRSCPDLRVLATSREPLRIPAERVFRLGVLDADKGGASLFAQRYRQAGGGESDLDASEVDAIVAAVDGLPLAIEMAASRAATVGLRATRRMLTERVSALSSADRTLPDRHRTVANIVDSSLDALDPTLRRAMFRLAAFVGPFDVEAAGDVLGDRDQHEAADTLAELVRRSLVEHSGQGRFRILRTVRERCQERGGGEWLAGVERHGWHFAGVAEHSGTRLFGPDEASWYLSLDEAIDDLRAATFRALDRGDLALASRIPAALLPYAYERLRADIAEWADRIIRTDAADAVEALPMAAVAALQRGDLETARDRCNRYLDQVPVGPGTLRALQLLGDIALYEGRFADVVRRGREVVDHARRLGRTPELSTGLHLVVLGHALGGDREAALESLTELRREAERSGSDILRGWASYCEGEIVLDSDPERAMHLFEDASERSMRSDAVLLEGVARSAGATVLARYGDPAEALRLFESTVVRFDERGDLIRMRVALRNLAVLFVRLGEFEPAAEILGSRLGEDRPGGAEADRLTEALSVLRGALGERAGHLFARGSARTDREVIDAALAAIAAARAGE